MLELLAAFDFSNILTLVKENLLPIILGSQLIPVNKPGTPYQPLVTLLLGLLTGKKPSTPQPVVPGIPTAPPGLLAMLIPFIQQLSQKPPVATVVAPPDPTVVPNDPNSLITWLVKLLNAPETPISTKPHIDSPSTTPVEVRWEHFTGCFQAMVDLYPDFDISAVSSNGNTEVKKVARVKKVENSVKP